MIFYEKGEFRASKDWPYAISAGCVVYRTHNALTEVLLLKRAAGHAFNHVPGESHNLPKGHVEFGDSLENTALRETAEEAGCKAELVTYLGSVERDFIHPFHKIHNVKTVLYFAARWQEDLSNIDSEHDGREWVSLDEAIKLLGAPNPKGEDKMVKHLKKFLELANA